MYIYIYSQLLIGAFCHRKLSVAGKRQGQQGASQQSEARYTTTSKAQSGRFCNAATDDHFPIGSTWINISQGSLNMEWFCSQRPWILHLPISGIKVCEHRIYIYIHIYIHRVKSGIQWFIAFLIQVPHNSGRYTGWILMVCMSFSEIP